MRYFFSFLMWSSVLLGTSQTIDFNALKGFKARCIGPSSTSGRITSIAVHPNDERVIYVGTASGGVWKSENGGTTWNPLFDKQNTLNIGAIAIDPSNPKIIWAGTGEGNPRNSHSSGKGIYRSLNGGLSWQLMGLENTKTIHRVIVHPSNSDIIWVASLGSVWGTNKERGVFKSIDGGKSWTKSLYVGETVGAADLIIDEQHPNRLFASMWEYGRKAWTFNSGGQGSGLYVSNDGGNKWTQLGEKHGLPKGPLGRIGITISLSNPNVVYALIESKNTAIYRSNDGGNKWFKVNDKNVGNRPFYYADIFVDPVNEDKLYNIWSRVSMSIDGGKNFKIIGQYYGVHPDHHAFYINPKNPKHLIDGNDGGLSISYDGGVKWEVIDNLPLSQFYHIRTDNQIPYNVYGGMQDNGSIMGPSKVKYRPIRWEDWQPILGADGFDVLPKRNFNDKNSDYVYAMWQGGGLSKVSMTTGRSNMIKPFLEDGSKLRFNWNAALADDPHNNEVLFYGSQFVHLTRDQGRHWKVISPDLTTNDTSKLHQDKSGGLTIDVTAAENHCSILSIEVSPIDSNIIWVGTDDGNIQVTFDRGNSWRKVNVSLKDVPKNAWVAQLSPSKFDSKTAVVIINNYRNNDFGTYVFRTINGGESWTSIIQKNVEGYALSFIEDPKVEGIYYLGTENGLWISIDGGAQWNRFNNNYPNVSTMDLAFNEYEDDLVLGTFGRSIYVLDDIGLLRSLVQKNWSLKNDFKITNTNKGMVWSAIIARGTAFIGDGVFKGETERYGAHIDYWMNPSLIKKDKKVKFEFFDSNDSLIRNYHVKPDTGLNRSYWNMTANGIFSPSHKVRKKDQNLPQGYTVSPGIYKVRISYLDSLVDSSTVEVVYSKDFQFNVTNYSSNLKALKSIRASISKANDLFEQLKEMENGLNLFEKTYQYKFDSLPKVDKDEMKQLRDSIKTYKALFIKPKNLKGYRSMDHLISYQLGLAHAYIVENGPLSPRVGYCLNKGNRSLEKAKHRIINFSKITYQAFINRQEKLKDILKVY